MQYIGIINLEMSNLGSIKNVILHLGKKAELINDFSNLNKFTHLIFPGIGSFAEASKIIKKKKLKKNLINFLEKGGKLFGICLGMQLMFESSEEHGKSSGLGLFKGKVIKFNEAKLKIPHMGFNSIKHDKNKIWKKIPTSTSFYFVHSYKVNYNNLKLSNNSIKCSYGSPFIAFIRGQNIFGCQFHPEKSGKQGIQLIKNFLDS